MLKKTYRLPASQKLLKPQFIKTPSFVLKLSANSLQHNRFGFIVKKSIDKRAVVRNRLRRIIRSCIEDMSGSLKEGHDMLFLLERGIIGKEREVIYQELRTLFSEKDLLK